MTPRSKSFWLLGALAPALLGAAACLYHEDERCPVGYVFNDRARACVCAGASVPACQIDAAAADANAGPDAGGQADEGPGPDMACEGSCAP
jgi:hypothetical protein